MNPVYQATWGQARAGSARHTLCWRGRSARKVTTSWPMNADEQVVAAAHGRDHPDRLATAPIREPVLPSRACGHPDLVLLTAIEKSPRTVLRAIWPGPSKGNQGPKCSDIKAPNSSKVS
jgi:hypothetical protein